MDLQCQMACILKAANCKLRSKVDQHVRQVVRRFRRRRRTYVRAREQYSADDHDHEKMKAWVLWYGAPHGGLQPLELRYYDKSLQFWKQFSQLSH